MTDKETTKKIKLAMKQIEDCYESKARLNEDWDYLCLKEELESLQK